MRDEETGTFWQQISGRAISGPLKGSQLAPVHSDELTFALWRSETPKGTVLKPLPADAAEYESKDWEVRMATDRTVLDFPNSGLRSRDLVVGVDAFGASRAYPVDRIFGAKLIEDRLGSEPVLVMGGADGKSIRVFRARFCTITNQLLSSTGQATISLWTQKPAANGIFADARRRVRKPATVCRRWMP